MAEPLDVGARLTEGRPAVDNVGEYVWACHLLGYQNPDLTLHAAQVRDWYGSEDGLDLRALEADRAALDSVAAATESARQLQERQVGALAGAWQGRSGEASREFLLRHGDASARTASAVRNAVDALTALRDDLWRAVDTKVATAVAIDDRRQAERPEWLAATQTVTTGAGDRAAASELIDQQVKPFVDNDIRSDWLNAMQRAIAAVGAAFDAATGVLTSESSATFAVPGDLGPSPMPPPNSAPPDRVEATVPSGWSSPPPASLAAPAVGPMTAPAPPFLAAQEIPAAPIPAGPAPAIAPASGTSAMPSMPSLGGMGGGLPGAAGGLAGLGSQFADAIGGLLNPPGDALVDPPDLNDTIDGVDEDEAVPDDDEDLDEVEDPEEEPDAETEELAETEESATEPVDACATANPVDETPPAEPVPTPPPAPMPPPPPPIEDPPPIAEPFGAETPCEIAADELPQAGP